ncbi:putative D-lactate dehydrogenase [Stappia sp. 22II-S9-Z10]|nr:putative D-lactate dehydrogenase [Stappia sp. 22II-S9-Z10]
MTIHAPIQSATLARLKEAAGPGGWIEGPDTEPYCVSWRDNWAGKTPLVLRPDTTERLAALVKICAETGTPIVPQGGNTGLTGGGQPHATGDEVVMSTTRLKRVRALDPLNDTITVEAGVTLLEVQNLAAEADRYFPLSLAAEGTCQIGGNLATNAGGVQVLRYGSARALCLGLEVVTADGEVWDGLRGLRKDNAGYDMKQIFIGSEGTLGIITAATLRLFPRPVDRGVALVAVDTPTAAVELLTRLRAALGELLSAFELMNANTFRFAQETMGHADPLPGAGWRVLIQADGPRAEPPLSERLEEALGALLEEGLVTDAVIATSEAQAAQLWRIREDQAEVQQKTGAGVKHDVSVPVSSIDAFVAEADAAMEAAYPGVRHCTFGHAGDGNLHYNPIRPVDWTDAAWKGETEAINRIVHDIVMAHNGSITAEHGVGRLRRAELTRARAPVELAMMRALKAAMDPAGILNPGKVLPD